MKGCSKQKRERERTDRPGGSLSSFNLTFIKNKRHLSSIPALFGGIRISFVIIVVIITGILPLPVCLGGNLAGGTLSSFGTTKGVVEEIVLGLGDGSELLQTNNAPGIPVDTSSNNVVILVFRISWGRGVSGDGGGRGGGGKGGS